MTVSPNLERRQSRRGAIDFLLAKLGQKCKRDIGILNDKPLQRRMNPVSLRAGSLATLFPILYLS